MKMLPLLVLASLCPALALASPFPSATVLGTGAATPVPSGVDHEVEWAGTLFPALPGSWSPSDPARVVVPRGCEFGRLAFAVDLEPGLMVSTGPRRVSIELSVANRGFPAFGQEISLPAKAGSAGSWTQLVPGTVIKLLIHHDHDSAFISGSPDTWLELECWGSMR